MSVPASDLGAERALAMARLAKASVPYYTRAFADADLEQPFAFTNLPLLSAATARRNQDALMSRDVHVQRDLFVERTSGTTGTPLRLVRSRREVMTLATSLWRARRLIYPDVMQARAVQLSSEPNARPESERDQLLILSPLELRRDRVDRYLDALTRFRPRWLRGHPAVLAVLAEGMRRANRRLSEPLVFVESNSGPLTESTRSVLQDAFDCRVVNHYGTREVYTISYECPKGVMHVLDDCVRVEPLMREAGPAEIAVTSLRFELMPFIRYVPGDLVTIGSTDCPCGSAAIEVRPVGGRTSELIEGTLLIGSHVFHTVVSAVANAGIDDILQYQVAQTSRDRFEVRLVVSGGASADRVSVAFREHAHALLPRAFFNFRFVDDLELTAGGKPRPFVREL